MCYTKNILEVICQERVRVFSRDFQTRENIMKVRARRPSAFIVLQCLPEIPVKHKADDREFLTLLLKTILIHYLQSSIEIQNTLLER